MKTLTNDFEKKSGWTLSVNSLMEFEHSNYVGCSTKMLPCGCGVKVDLQEIVYPVLKKSTNSKSSYSNERLDAFITSGEIVGLKRIIIKSTSSDDEMEKIAEEIFKFEPNLFLELISADFEGIELERLKKEKYENLFNKKCEFINKLSHVYAKNNKEYAVEFGKGHSVRAGADIIVLDFIKLDKTKTINSAFNHDSIITADSILNHTCLTSIFVSLNNALNDLFSNGVYENIQIYPVYDGQPEEIKQLQKNLSKFIEFYKERGVQIQLFDQGPLNQKLKIVGASVVGTTSKDNRKFSHLNANDDIIITKHLGDLSFLSMYRSYYFQGHEKKSLSTQRYAVLQEMTTSNYLIAKLINSYLPDIKSSHDINKNISFSTDISGPGTDVLLEAADASQRDIQFNNPIFLEPTSLYHTRKNHSSSTNGPIAIAGQPTLISEISSKLFELGFERLWKIGKVK